MEHNKKVFNLTNLAGEVLLGSGAEIFRVEETMLRIAKAYDLNTLDTFVIVNGIFATAQNEGQTLSARILHVPTVYTHLGKVAEVNNLSREIEKNAFIVDEAYEKLLEINELPAYSNIKQVFSAGLGSFCFCYLLKGDIKDSLCSFVIGCLLWLIIIQLQKHKVAKVVTNIIGSIFVTTLAIIMTKISLGNHLDKIIIGSIILLIPGVPFTNAIKDFIDNNYISGSIRMLDALLIAISIAIGVGLVLELYKL